MKTPLDLENWNRKEHFLFFKQIEPFFGIATTIDCTIGYETAKQLGTSFFCVLFAQNHRCSNAIEAFRYRIIGDCRRWQKNHIDVSTRASQIDGRLPCGTICGLFPGIDE